MNNSSIPHTISFVSFKPIVLHLHLHIRFLLHFHLHQIYILLHFNLHQNIFSFTSIMIHNNKKPFVNYSKHRVRTFKYTYLQKFSLSTAPSSNAFQCPTQVIYHLHARCGMELDFNGMITHCSSTLSSTGSEQSVSYSLHHATSTSISVADSHSFHISLLTIIPLALSRNHKHKTSIVTHKHSTEHVTFI